METPTPTGWPARLGRALASRWALPVLALAAFGVSLLVQQTVYPGLSWNRDEPVYLWQVDVLRAGQLSTTDGGHPELFQPWLSAARDGTLFSQYTLGWPLVLLLGALLGSTDLAVAAGAALAVVGTWAAVHELLRDRVMATVAAAAMVASPILAVQGGVHLNYLFTLGLGLLFVTALSNGVRRSSRAHLLAAGALLGWIFFTRPYDAIVWGLVGVILVIVEHRATWRRLVPSAAWSLIGLVPLVIVTLAINHRLTGRATEFPITVADPLDQFGFGTRRLMPGLDKIDYDASLAAESTGRNAFWLPFFLVGAHLGAVVAAGGAWVGRRERGVRALVGLGLAFPLAYVAFFGTRVSSLTARLSGPIYYIPAYTALCGLMAVALVRLGRAHPRRAGVLGLAILAVTIPISANRLAINRDLSLANQPWARSLDQLEGRSIVVPSPPAYLLFVNPYGDNGADLDGRILFASDGLELLDLLAEHPDRAAYLQRADRSVGDLLPSEHPVTPEVILTPMEVLRGEVHLRGAMKELDGAATTLWWVEADGATIEPPRPVSGTDPLDVDMTALGLADGLHVLEVKLGERAERSDAAIRPAVRRTFYVRVTGGEVEVLAPGTASRFIRRPSAAVPVWEDVLTVPELQIDPVLDSAR